MREAPNNFLQIEFTEDSKFLLHMDFSQLLTTGLPAISDFLQNLHCYKSTGDITRGRALFSHYSKYDKETEKIRDIIVANQKPRGMEVQCNLSISNTSPSLSIYSESFDGIIESFLERFPETDHEMLAFWEEDFQLSRLNK
jgi:dipeptidyl-peptidase-3